MRALFAAQLSASLLIAAMAHAKPVLIHSNDVLGEIEPCGCRSNPLGGMIRKEKFLNSHPLLQKTPDGRRGSFFPELRNP
jgi:hypothetical protein